MAPERRAPGRHLPRSALYCPPLSAARHRTVIVQRLISEAVQAILPLKLDVVKINPALRLYQRLGFRITGEEEHKFNMTLDPGPIGDS